MGENPNASASTLLASGRSSSSSYIPPDPSAGRQTTSYEMNQFGDERNQQWDMQTELQRQDHLAVEQDIQLDNLSYSLGSLKQIGQDIHIEVNYHNELLEELGSDIERHQTRMDRLNRRLKEIMRSQSSKCLLLYIGLLVVGIIVMLFTM